MRHRRSIIVIQSMIEVVFFKLVGSQVVDDNKLLIYSGNRTTGSNPVLPAVLHSSKLNNTAKLFYYI